MEYAQSVRIFLVNALFNLGASMRVKDLMSIPIYMEIPTSRRELLEFMKKRNINFVPLVKRNTKKVVGVITRNDLLRHPDEEQIALIMNRNLLTVTPNTSITEAAKKILDNNQRYLLVVDDELKGVLSVADIVWKFIAIQQFNETVEQFMSRKFLCLWHHTPVKVAYKIMKFDGAEAAPVIDDRSTLVGFITISDILNAVQVIIKDKTSHLSTSGESQEWDWDVSSVVYITKEELEFPDKTVADIMSKKVYTVATSTTISECARKMRKLDIDQMPVTDANGNLVGIIRDIHLLSAL